MLYPLSYERVAAVYRAASREPGPSLLQQLRGLGETRAGAFVVVLLARAGARDPAQDLAIEHDRHAAAERQDTRHVSLRRARRIVRRRLLELQCRGTEHDRGVSLASRHVDGRRICELVAQDHEQRAGTVDDGYGRVEAAALTGS